MKFKKFQTGGYFDQFSTLPTSLTYGKPTAITQTSIKPEFNPEAGRQEAYDTRWNAYINELGKNNKKVNLNEARQYFDQQFDTDWFNETAQRKQQFLNNQAKYSNQGDLNVRANNYNKFVGDLFNQFKRQTTPLTANAKTNGLDFSSVQAVQQWLINNGYNPGTADNLYGTKTKGAIDALLANANSGLTEEEKQMFRNFQNNTRLVGNRVRTQSKPIAPKQSGITEQRTVVTEQAAYPDEETSLILRGQGFRPSYNQLKSLADLNNEKWSAGITLNPNESRGQAFARWDHVTNPFKNAKVDPIIQKQLEEERARARLHNYQVVANNPTKYQQGGRMNNQEEIQKAFMAYLIEDAAAQGVKIQSEQDLQAYAQQLGEEGLKVKYQEFMQRMQGGVKAKFGAKLDYVRKLKGLCPEGEELVYLKKGGRVCSVCQKKVEKAIGGTKTPKKNAVQDFKSKRPTKYDGKKHERLAELNALKKATPAQKDSLNTYQELYKKLPNSVKRNKYNDQTVEENKCGGKTKKLKKRG